MPILEWARAPIERVCRGSLPAEYNEFQTTDESAESLNNAIEEIQHASFTTLTFDPFVDGNEIPIVTDVGSLSSSLENHGGQRNDKRVRILRAQIKDFMGYATSKDNRGKVGWKLATRWIGMELMLADALTKTGAERGYLLECMNKYKWTLAPTGETLKRRKIIGEARRARKAELRAREAS